MKPCILVVDDEVDVASLICDHLETQGFRVTHCHDAAQAFIQAEGMRVGLIIADIMMPVFGSGVDLYHKIRATPYFGRNLPIIFLTGIQPQAAQRMVPLHDPCVRLLFKPTTLVKLSETIAELTGKRLLEDKPKPPNKHAQPRPILPKRPFTA